MTGISGAKRLVERRPSIKEVVLPALAVGAVAWVLGLIVVRSMTSLGRGDPKLHNQIVIDWAGGEPMPGYSIYYPLLRFLAAGDLSPAHLMSVACVILATAVAAKALVAFVFAWWVTGRHWGSSVIVAGFVLFVTPLTVPGIENFYLGKFTSAIWHNSTTMLLMPVSAILFYVSWGFLSGGLDRASAWWVVPLAS